MVQTVRGILFSLKKEIPTRATTGMNVDNMILSEPRRAQKNQNSTMPLIIGTQSYPIQSPEVERRSPGAGYWRGGESVFIKDTVSVWDDDGVLEAESGEGWATL